MNLDVHTLPRNTQHWVFLPNRRSYASTHFPAPKSVGPAYRSLGIAQFPKEMMFYASPTMPKSPPTRGKHKVPARKFRCVIVEDQVMFEQLVGLLLRAEDLVKVVATAHTVKEGVEICHRHRPDLLLLDLGLPDGDGLAVARALAACQPGARTIIVSGQADTFRCPPDLKQHIYSVIDKTRTFEVVRQELAGCLGQMSPAGAPAGQSAIARLSPREEEIFRLVGHGMSTKEIAAAASISPQTVETHRKKIAAKLGLRAAAMVRQAALHTLTVGTAAPGA